MEITCMISDCVLEAILITLFHCSAKAATLCWFLKKSYSEIVLDRAAKN